MPRLVRIAVTNPSRFDERRPACFSDLPIRFPWAIGERVVEHSFTRLERTAPPAMHADEEVSQDLHPSPNLNLQKTEMTAEEIAVRKQHLAQALRAAKRGEMKQGGRTGESHG